MMKRFFLLFLFMPLFLLLQAEYAGTQDQIKIGMLSVTFSHAPLLVAKEKGFYKREGLDAEIIAMNKNELIVQALVSDSIQFATTSPPLLLSLSQRGITDIKMIAGFSNGTIYSLIALPRYKKIEDLKGGARLAVASFSSGSTLLMKYLLKQKGVLYPRDYNLLQVGGLTAQWMALQSKQVDAAMLVEPLNTIAVDQGYSNLGDIYKLLPNYLRSAVGIRKEWARKNRDIVIRFIKALVFSSRWLYENREEAIKILPSVAKLDKKYIPNSWETYTKNQIWTKDGSINLKGIQTVIEVMDDEGILKKPLPKPEDIVDLSYLEEATRAFSR